MYIFTLLVIAHFTIYSKNSNVVGYKIQVFQYDQ